MIEVRDLTKYFGRVHAVDGVSFKIGAGEVVGLLGPNGSGKTTLMRILTGYFPPTSGTASVAGCDLRRDSLSVRQRVGYVPEHVVLYPDLPVRRFLMFACTVKGVEGPRRRERVQSVMRACGLEEVEKRLIGKLSRGYRQRVAIAQALLSEPEVLILDEPTVGLDPRQTVEIRTLIRSLGGRRTVLLSTHILPEVSLLCGRVIIVDRGRIVAEDTATALARRVEGVKRTLVRVAGPKEAVAAGLEGVAGVSRVEADGDGRAGSEGEQAFVVTSEGGARVGTDLAGAVIAGGWQLVELRPLEPSLEELFVRILGRDRGDAGHA